jgi:hypothetical protein
VTDGGEVLERPVWRIERHLRRCGLLGIDTDEAEPDGEGDPEGNLAASAVWGQAPQPGPQWRSRLAPLEPHALGYDKPLCASLDGFTLRAATRAGAFHPAGREALLRYVLRPPLAQERAPRWSGAHHAEEGLRRRDDRGRHGPAVALCRLAASVPPPRRHTIRYSGVLAPASPWRPSLAPMAPSETPADGPRPPGRRAPLPPVKGQ